MNVKFLLATVALILLVVMMYVFQQAPVSEIPENVSCSVDADCVPAEACHADSCINKNFKEDRGLVYCTSECAPGTMDCGQGRCGCINKKCEAIINE